MPPQEADRVSSMLPDARCYTGIIRGSVAMFVFMGRSTKRMALFSAALWIVRELIAGWKFGLEVRPDCMS